MAESHDDHPREPAASALSKAWAAAGERPWSFYVHVPFCATRCGYCDFNTYIPERLGVNAPSQWLEAALAEVEIARQVLPDSTPPISTIFFGGGTPTLMTPGELGQIVARIREYFGLVEGAEITTEANPETLSPQVLSGLVEAGITRISMGMQSAVPHVLHTLERRHTPGKALEMVEAARQAGIGQVSLDLIYGTPGESLEDWMTSVRAACSAQPDHISAYALVIEPGTAMGRALQAGQIEAVDGDVQAQMYTLAEDYLSAHGYTNYEISNWSTTPATRARHNLAYWRSDHWWGVGPGAHSHCAGARWWNHRFPATYASALANGSLPIADHEIVDDATRRIERVLLEIRVSEGLEVDVLTPSERERMRIFIDRGWVREQEGRYTLSVPGRLMADAIVRDILD